MNLSSLMTQFVSSSPDVTFSFNCVANIAAVTTSNVHYVAKASYTNSAAITAWYRIGTVFPVFYRPETHPVVKTTPSKN